MSSPISGFAGYNSGLPVDTIIAQLIAAERRPVQLMEQKKAKIKSQQTIYNSIQSKTNDLLVALRKLTDRSIDGTSLFDSMIGISSNDKIATATIAGTASPQSLTLEVKSLPTQTRAISTGLVGKFDGTTTLSQLGITDGSFKIYANGTEYTITVDDAETMDTVFQRINTTVAEVTVDPTIVGGKVKIDYAPGTVMQLGSGSDTSNFLSKTFLNTGIDNGSSITASQVNTTINLDAQLGSANLTAGVVTDGTFTINGQTFDTTGKTINEIISAINNNANAKVTAKFNKTTNKMELTAKDTGSALINMADGTGNFLSVMNLVSGTDHTVSQAATRGTNAEFVLNGNTMYSTSTSVTDTVHGLTGVTLNLKKAEVGTTIDITVQRDKDALKTAIKDVVEKYNKVIAEIDKQTDAKNKAPLAGESQLKSLRGQIRSLFTAKVSGLTAGTPYDSLQAVGISTGAVTGSALATPTLTFDEAKFDTAFAADPNTVEKLFTGKNLYGALDGTAGDDGMEGTLTQIEHLLSDKTYINASGTTVYGALYNGPDESSDGLFYSWQNSANKRIKDLDESIERAEDRLELKKKLLQQQFLAMDRMIGQYQSQGAAITNLMNQMNASRKQ